ncbi:hydrocephalus-inducing protein homolog [Opisthocomus hoazin]|uniref:hydrocephalus-inducing protein homolog n=1 Tax=Opisthocomus hoazin TaxID=30419 RepID=UPI003F5292FE
MQQDPLEISRGLKLGGAGSWRGQGEAGCARGEMEKPSEGEQRQANSAGCAGNLCSTKAHTVQSPSPVSIWSANALVVIQGYARQKVPFHHAALALFRIDTKQVNTFHNPPFPFSCSSPSADTGTPSRSPRFMVGFPVYPNYSEFHSIDSMIHQGLGAYPSPSSGYYTLTAVVYRIHSGVSLFTNFTGAVTIKFPQQLSLYSLMKASSSSSDAVLTAVSVVNKTRKGPSQRGDMFPSFHAFDLATNCVLRSAVPATVFGSIPEYICHETRLPLRINVEGIGPRLRFGFEQLDIGMVLVGSANSYEAILFNKGAIDARFSLVPPATALGSCFTFLPQEGSVVPDGLHVIRISFSSTTLGPFTEEFRFSVDGSPEPATLTIRGCVIGPTCHFSVPALHFGDVSFGFPRTLSCRLTNTSLVPMTVNLRIPGDGQGEPSVTSFDQVSDKTRPSWRKGLQGHVMPTEFTVTPCKGTVRSQGSLDIEVTLCSSMVKSYELALVVDMEGVGKEVLALLLTARCVVPPLRVLNPVVTFGRCFLKFPCRRMLTLVNDSDLPGCYGLLPQVWHRILSCRQMLSRVLAKAMLEQTEGAAVRYSSPEPCGIIQPHSSVQVPVTLEAQVTGEQDTVARVAVLGSEGSPLKIHLVSTGEGPVVYVHPSKINFGSIQVLQDASRTLHLSNQSVIPASFRAEMAGKRSCWRIEPSRGVIPPESEVSVTVIANLNDTEKFKDEVTVFIENSHSYVVPVRAVGIGTTIVTDRPFAPELNLGIRFSLHPCCYRFRITNKGRRTHLLYWTTEGFAPFRQRDRLPAISNSKGKDSSQSPKPACPVFQLRPPRMELMPGKTMEMVLEGFSSTPQVVTERLLCHAVVGSEARKTQIMQVDVTCEFIDPLLQMSSREITFRVEKQPSDVLTFQYKRLSLKNVSLLPVSVVLALEQPFVICDADRQLLSADVQIRNELLKERQYHLNWGSASWLEGVRRGQQAARSGQASPALRKAEDAPPASAWHLPRSWWKVLDMDTAKLVVL